MLIDNFEAEEIISELTKNLTLLVDEVKLLSERQSILEEKLIFAFNQYQKLVDKYDAEDSNTLSVLAELQTARKLLTDDVGYVCSPQLVRTSTAGITTIILKNFLLKERLANFIEKLSGSTLSVKCTSSTGCDPQNSQPSFLENVPTITREKNHPECPLMQTARKSKLIDHTKNPNLRVKIEHRTSEDNIKPNPYDLQDSTCAVFAETKPVPNTTPGRSKCPIRFLGQRSPEEVAKYFESHKHEIPRSHEICVKRQQKNEDHIKKLDEKYGNLVSMIEELGQKHRPLLPDDKENVETQKHSNRSLEKWAQSVSVTGLGQDHEEQDVHDQNDREPKFDRYMREIRLGESPSRPWGIPIPITNLPKSQRSESQPSPASLENIESAARNPLSDVRKATTPSTRKLPNQSFLSHQHQNSTPNDAITLPDHEPSVTIRSFLHTNEAKTKIHNSPSEIQNQKNITTIPQALSISGAQMPHMNFTGPVFIGYSTDDAVRLVQQLK